jgi:hypothetical protein
MRLFYCAWVRFCWKLTWDRGGWILILPSRPGEFHPEPLTELDLNVSIHPARAIARRLPPSIAHWVPPVAD